ncbi:MAG: sensor histidine kinase [Candidatus Parabeggiatoa sp.]|nr:sensor histidine kinase [Candidatus Parabeggiatoa sp.]
MARSIRTLFTIPLVVLILLLAMVIIEVSYYNGQRAVGEISTQLHQEISARIRQHIQHFLQAPQLVNALNTKLDTSNFEYLADQFQHQLTVSEVPYIFYGNEQGHFIGVQQIADKTVLKILEAESAPLRHIYEIDESGERIQHLERKTKRYDPRNRPWYQKAKKRGQATWSDIYVSAHRHVLQITYAVPVYDEDYNLRGVFGANFILSQISDLMKEMKIGKTGLAFIIAHTGKLVAASTNTPLSAGVGTHPLSADNSRSPVIQSVAKYITDEWNSISLFSKEQRQALLKLDGRTTELSVYEEGQGIQWLIAVSIPDSDFTEGIKDNMLWTLGLSLLAVLVAIIVGIVVAQQVTKPIRLLNQHVKALSGGDWKNWNLSTDIKRQDEIGELALSFSVMAEQLTGLLNSFEDKVEQSVENLHLTNVDLEALSRSMANDLRNPISEILGFTAKLLQSHDKKLDMQGRHFLQVISSSGEKSIEIIDSLLLLVAVISKEKVETQSLDMRSCVASVTQELESIKKKYYGSITVADKLPNALGDPIWVKEVWTNYLSNGLKYGGTPPSIEIGADVKEGMVEYWVKDNGEGMTTEEVSKLFAQATRLDKHGEKEGFGFGLLIVHRIVTKQGGKVGVESEPGKGSRFWFTLPAVKRG